MADRCFVTEYESVQATGVAGEFMITVACNFFHDNAQTLDQGNASFIVTATMTPAQMLAAMVAAIVELGSEMRYTVAASNNQILIPQMTKA